MFDGTDATQDLTFLSASAGTVASATDQQYTGPRALKMSTGSPAVLATATFNGVLADAGRRISFRMRVDTWAGGPDILRLANSAGTTVFNLFRTSATGTLTVLATGTAAAGTTAGSIVLSTNTWYRIAVSYVITNSTTYTIKVYIDGVLDITRSNLGTMTQSGTDRIILVAGVGLGTNANAWFDDLFVDDSNATTDPGTTNVNSLRVTNKRPFANGTTNGFSTQIGAGGSGYGTGHAPQVNEQPLSQTNGWSAVAPGVATTEEYTIEGETVGDFSLVGYRIIDYMGWVFAKTSSAETAQIKVGGTASNIALTTTAALFRAVKGSTVYPTGGTNIGIISAATATTTSLYEAGALFTLQPLTPRIFKLAGFGGGLAGPSRGLAG